MDIDFSKMVCSDDPQWLSRVIAANGSDDGEVLAISPKLLYEARVKSHKNGAGYRRRKAVQDLLRLLLGK
jgi:hypothetical protein